MILILSQAKNEPTTENVMDWLGYFGANFIRLNGDSFLNKGALNYSINNNSINNNSLKGLLLHNHFNLINVVWFRRWHTEDNIENIQRLSIDKKTYDMLSLTLRGNMNVIKSYLFFKLRNKKWLSHPNSVNVNKLIVLEIALSLGIKIPSTLVCSSKKELIKFKKENVSLITKDIHRVFTLAIGGDFYDTMTKEVDEDFIKKLPTFFKPTLFQEKIEKIYEIRAFFLDGHFYSMAIFSQNDEKTKLDFRNYNDTKPNRYVPFLLPYHICLKLTKLMSALKLNTGSIDLIKNTDGEYIFLEVNPVGQFGMVSYPCNYYLEKKIAEFLIKNDEKSIQQKAS